jgi:histidyl-tRNA synthetase
MNLSNPPGCRDFFGKDLDIRQHIFNIARQKFTQYGGKELDTPVLEYYSNVDSLYGDEFSESVFMVDSADGSDKLFMRYDLTVPFARFVGSNGIKFIKRFQIGKVYRKDTPQILKGRYREFYQCDFDIVGDDQGSSIFDIEIISLLNDILSSLLGNKFTIMINFRQIIFKIIKNAGVPDDKIMDVTIILDKLDKKSWEELLIEFEKLSISKEIYDRLRVLYNSFKDLDSITDMYHTLIGLDILDDSFDKTVKHVIEYIIENKFANFRLNPFLARGLHYYTGIIFEAMYNSKEIMDLTIASGGRYDKMIGKFSNTGDVPAIGLSLGIERLSKIINETYVQRTLQYDVYVATIGAISVVKRMMVVSKLRMLGNIVAYSHHASPKMREHLDFALDNNIPYMIIIGENEVKNNLLTLKTLSTKTQKTVPENDLFEMFKKI